MKIYIRSKGVILTGKAWEIQYMLKKYQKEFTYVQEWVNASSRRNISPLTHRQNKHNQINHQN